MLTAVIAFLVLVLCCGMRWFLDRPSRRKKSVAGGHIELTALWNEGAAFGLPIPAWLLRLLSCGALVFLWNRRRESPVGVGLFLGGGLSNLLERLHAGRVFDYVRFPHAPGKLRRYVFNLADFAVFLGGVLWILGKRRK